MENADNTVSKVKKYRLDVIVIAAILILSLSVLLIVTLTRKDGAIVRIEVDGETVKEYPLAFNLDYTVKDGANVIRIKDGQAYMIHSDCPDHTCERTGKIRYVGQTIVCLPNKVTVTIIGEQSDDSIDFTS